MNVQSTCTARARGRAAIRFAHPLVVAALAAGLSGCDRAAKTPLTPSAEVAGSNATADGTAPVQPGHIWGTATVAGDPVEIEGVLTADGVLRLNVDGPSANPFDPSGSVQIVAELVFDGASASGSGAVIGQGCAVALPSRFCGKSVPARIALTAGQEKRRDPNAMGEVRVEVDTGEEIWTLAIGYWGGRASFGAAYPIAALKGQYEEQLAEYARNGDVTINLDSAGRLFFQSPGTGCVGNGSLGPYLDGRLKVYRVTLDIAACEPAHGFLNATFEGLATFEPWNPWDYFTEFPRMWLSTPGGTAALTALATPVGEPPPGAR